jgi:Protein of unknown function (DUF2769)
MMNMKKSQAMMDMMNKMSDSEKMMMEKMMTRMCKCQDCSTMTSCMTDPAMVNKMGGLFCGMDGKMMPCQPQKMESMVCMCPSCPVASDMGMAMTTPCMGKK